MVMHTNGPDYTTRNIRRAIVAWLKEDGEVASRVSMERLEMLVRRLRQICTQPQ